MIINVEDFLLNKSIKFKSSKQAVSWVKRNLKPSTLLKVGPSYLVEEREIEKLYNLYVKQQKELSESRVKRIKALNKKKLNTKRKPPEEKEVL